MRQRLPKWFRRPLPTGAEGGRVERLLGRLELRTVCEGAKCPNRAACWGGGAAAFLILGSACTRDCRFCAIPHEAAPPAPDSGEPARVAAAAAEMGLGHVVVTSVTRDDLADGGAGHFAATIREIRAALPGATVEVLVPDFRGDAAAIDAVLAAGPDVFNHNVETVPRLYKTVRPGADYRRSLAVLARAGERVPGMPTKSGLMLGLGETHDEVVEVMRDLREAGVELLTLGQYLRPSAAHLPVAAFVEPDEFAELARVGRRLGFSGVASAPFVRSSYHAAELLG